MLPSSISYCERRSRRILHWIERMRSREFGLDQKPTAIVPAVTGLAPILNVPVIDTHLTARTRR